MRNRLIGLLENNPTLDGMDGTPEDFVVCADYLMENGILAPPVKIGQTVYPLHADRRFRAFVERIEQTANGMFFDWVQYDVGVDTVECYDEERFDAEDIGKTVFLDEIEYLKALLMERGGAK